MKVEHPFLQYPLSLTNDNQTYELHINNDTRLISNNVSSLLNMTLSGAGICLALPDWLASKFLKSGELERVLPEWQLPELPIYLVWRYRQNYSMLFNDFRKYIEVRWRDLLANGIQ
jgi:DNA-binding transcriptional LysR family regulator